MWWECCILLCSLLQEPSVCLDIIASLFCDVMTRLIWNKQILWIASATNHATILFIANTTKQQQQLFSSLKWTYSIQHDWCTQYTYPLPPQYCYWFDLDWIGLDSGNGNKCNNQSRHAMHSPSIAKYYSLRQWNGKHHLLPLPSISLYYVKIVKIHQLPSISLYYIKIAKIHQ